jgi:hypothetical protein
VARMIETQDVREGDVVSFATMAGEYVVEQAEPMINGARWFEVSDLGGDEQRYVKRIPESQGVIVRLRDGKPFGDEDMVHARAMRWS